MTAYLNQSAAYLLNAPTPDTLERVRSRVQQIALPEMVFRLLETCLIEPGQLALQFSAKALADGLKVDLDDLATTRLRFEVAFQVRRRGVESRLVIGAGAPRLDEKLIRAIALAHVWLEDVRAGTLMTEIAKRQNCSQAFIRQRLQLSFLSPAITAEILAGRQPPELTLTNLVAKRFTSEWDAQWVELGFLAQA